MVSKENLSSGLGQVRNGLGVVTESESREKYPKNEAGLKGKPAEDMGKGEPQAGCGPESSEDRRQEDVAVCAEAAERSHEVKTEM